MVASSANISRPRRPSASGDIALALVTKAAMSSAEDGCCFGKRWSAPWPADLGTPGSSDMNTPKALSGLGLRAGQCAAFLKLEAQLTRSVAYDRRVRRDRPGIRHRRRNGRVDRPQRALVVEHLVQHFLDRRLGFVRTRIAHVVVPERSAHDRYSGLFADFLAGNDARIRPEDGVFRPERDDFEPAIGHEWHAQIVQRHDLLDLIG